MHLCVVVVLLLCINRRSTPTPNAQPWTAADVNSASPPLTNNSPQSPSTLQYRRGTHQKQHIAPTAFPSSHNATTTAEVRLRPNGCSSHAMILHFHCDYRLTTNNNGMNVASNTQQGMEKANTEWQSLEQQRVKNEASKCSRNCRSLMTSMSHVPHKTQFVKDLETRWSLS